MRDEYKAATLKYGQYNGVPWKNPFEFEVQKDFEDIEGTSVKEPNWLESPKLDVQFSPNSLITQRFPLPPTILVHIIDESKVKHGAILHKLHQTCKYFFVKAPYPVFYALFVGGELSPFVAFKDQTARFFGKSLDKVIITRKIICSNFLQVSSKYVSLIYPKRS